MQEKTVFKLSNPINVQYKLDGKNDFMDIEEIHLQAPSPKEKDITRGLKKKFIEAMFSMTSSISRDEAQQKATTDEAGELDEKGIKAVLFAAKGFDVVDFFNRFSVLLERVAFKDEEMQQKMIRIEFDKLDDNDFEDLVASYIQVFFIVSWMKTIS